jgi:hypothetical protein
MIVLQTESQLFDVIGALGASGCSSRGLYGREQEGHQDSDNGIDDKQFDEGERRNDLFRAMGRQAKSFHGAHLLRSSGEAAAAIQ